ncbi:hypothetical protein GW17_00058983 [Ensete ventricosum]|nr:hypothetical protein GW17_00058983 [Ensete ventricosum]
MNCHKEKIAVGRRFRRSESFPALKSAAKSAFRARCISLPSRSHPLVTHLADDLHSLRSWPLSPSSSSSSDAVHWICDGLARLHLLLTSLFDVLQLPQAQDPLRRGRRRSPALADRFLDDFLRLANAHGSFRSATLALQQDLAAARSQSAVATSSASRAVSAPSAALGRSWPSSRRPLENSRRGHSPVPPPGRQPTQRRRGWRGSRGRSSSWPRRHRRRCSSALQRWSRLLANQIMIPKISLKILRIMFR